MTKVVHWFPRKQETFKTVRALASSSITGLKPGVSERWTQRSQLQ